MVKWSVQHKAIVILLVVLTLLMGFFSYTALERQENPKIVAPIATVKCIYPGASPEDIEKLIVKPIEDEVGEIAEIKRIESFSMDSIGVLKVTLKDMSDARIDKAWEELKDKVDDAAAVLPSNARTPVVDTDLSSTYGVIFGVASEDYSYEMLSLAAKRLRDELSKEPGVKAVDIKGEIGMEVDINLDMVKLEQYGVSPMSIVTALKARNINIPGGNLEIGKVKTPVKVSGEYADIAEIENTIVAVSLETGAPVYLKNVAEVVKSEETREVFSKVNNKKALLIGVKYMDGQDMTAISDRINAVADKFRAGSLYENMELIKITDQADFVKSAIALFQENLASAIILVVLVVLLTMGIRSALVVSLPIPIVMAMVFIYMYMAGIPLHQVSIASLIVSLSLLVANGIVANDNINVYLDRGDDRLTACVKGIAEVNIPILTSTLTTVASFLPLAMMQGTAGKFAKSLPILVTVALIGSYMTSLTVVPVTGYRLLKPNAQEDTGKGLKASIMKALHAEDISNRILKLYGNTLKQVLRAPVALILFFTVLLAASMAVIPQLGVQLFPPVDRDQYIIDVKVMDGSNSEKTGEAVSKVGAILEADGSVKNYAVVVGDGMLKYYTSFMPGDLASNKAQLLVNGRRSEMERLERELCEKIPGAYINIRQLETASPVTYPVQIRVSGDDINELRRIAEEIREKVYGLQGVKNMEIDYGNDSYKLSVAVNEEKANLVGITNYDIASTVRMAVNGLEVSELKQQDIDKDPLPIVIKVPEEQKKNRDILDSIFLTSQITGKNVPIGQVAEIKTESSMNRIVRRDAERTITIGMFVRNGYSSNKAIKACEERLKDYRLPEGYTLQYGGESEDRTDAFTSMKLPAVLALFIIYLIMVFQFGDLVKPLIIMGTIPLSFIGIIWGLKLMGYPVGFMALIGAISLMGVVVNNGIVLLDYIKILMEKYDDEMEAIIEACKTRLRPIIIGMITTVISLLPMIKTGGDLWAPMATSIVFGMLVSSVLTMYVIPCAYYIVEIKMFKKNKAAGTDIGTAV